VKMIARCTRRKSANRSIFLLDGVPKIMKAKDVAATRQKFAMKLCDYLFYI
jgi:hypothetical protein